MVPEQDTRRSYIGRAVGTGLKICYGITMLAFSAVLRSEDYFSKKRDEYRVRYDKKPLRKPEERCS